VFLIFAAIGILVLGGAAAFLAGSSSRRVSLIGAGAVYAACLLAALGLVSIWMGRSPAVLRLPWSVPLGSLSFAVDPLSTWFLLPLLPLTAVCAAYGAASMGTGHGDPASERSQGAAWLFFDLLVASLLVVLTARNAILFLVAWEVMALASFFLVTWEDERREVREAGWVYLVATHVGTAFLLAFFAILGTRAQSLDFDALSVLPAGAVGGACFLMAVAGFGTKAGFVPFHVWLPEAHPAAPSHVSALMSGLMIKTGIYGLLRALEFLGAPSPWWGWLLLGIGLVSGVFGAAFALVQHDLKRLLAYSSIENMGLVALALGLGVLGLVAGAPVVAALGFAAALVHVLNHALFKGLLFLAAGSVLHATGRLDLDCLGGLLRRMPRTGACAMVGAAAISGLPPLGGFVGEFLLFLAALQATLTPTLAVPGVIVLVGGALVAGLAAAAFTKVFGIGFLGHARSAEAAAAHESDGGLTRPMLALAGACLLAGFAWTWPFTAVFGGGPGGAARPLPAGADIGVILAPTATIPIAFGILVALCGLLAWTRRRLLRGRPVRRSVTWDCGYARPDARMQYTGSSYVLPLADLFQPLVRTRSEFAAPHGLFPPSSRLRTTTPALFRTLLYEPAFDRLRSTLQRLKWLQHGRLQLYVLYIVVVFVLLLVWHAGNAP
jgi:formate hydrogenlyase subunit 3/multisubunit Na+/H+ antiporter MnhD subunit